MLWSDIRFKFSIPIQLHVSYNVLLYLIQSSISLIVSKVTLYTSGNEKVRIEKVLSDRSDAKLYRQITTAELTLALG